jgi:murein L,D-transpeptidase YcbB/YkuD
MVQLAKPTIENSAIHKFSGSMQVLQEPSNLSSSVVALSGASAKRLPMIGATPTAEHARPKTLRVAAEPEAKPDAEPAETEAPPGVKPQPQATEAQATQAPATEGATISTQPEPTAVTAAPETATAATAIDQAVKPVQAAQAPIPEKTSAPDVVAPAAAPAVAPAPTVPELTTTASVQSKAPVSPEPAAANPSAVNSNPADIATTIPINNNPVNQAPSAIASPVDVATPVPSNTPVVSVTPVIPLQSSITQDMLATAIKGEVDTRFVAGKPADEKKLTSEERKSHAAIVAFYSGRNDQPLWVDAKGLTQTAKQAIDRLSRASEDGLNASDYPVPAITGDLTAESLAKAEIALTQSAMKYARQAQAGRFDPSRLGELVTEKPSIPDPDSVLKSLAAASNISDALEAYNPPHEGYKRLKAKLAEIEAGKPVAVQARVPAGPTIRPGEKDTRVALLRNRLGVTGTATADDAAIYDEPLVEAVKMFQKTRGLKPSGLIGQQTVDAVNDDAPGIDTRAADIIANMERWRWLSRDLGQLHVMVNVPDFSLTVVRDGVVTHKTKAIVGRVANPTPIFSETMTHIIVNPYWNVPYSIVKKEYLAKAQETNGEALTRGNFEVEVGNKTVDPATVDWTTVNASEVHLRQRPGEGNALGNIKFMFPNQHSVYIHDTSSRGLFVQSYRSLSHGCVRVQDPFSFADALLAEEPTALTGTKLKSMLGGGEKYLWLKKTIPVHIAYFTEFVDDAGMLQTRPDLYGHNARTKQLLGL